MGVWIVKVLFFTDQCIHICCFCGACRDRQRQLRKWQKQFGKQMQEQKNKLPMKNRNASVQVRENWAVVEEMDFPRLTKLSLPSIPEPVDLSVYFNFFI